MQNPMFIRQSLRKVVLLYFAHCVSSVWKKEAVRILVRSYVYVHELSFKFIWYHAEEKVSCYVHIHMYCSYAHNSCYHPHNSHTKSPVLRQMGHLFLFFVSA